VKQIGKGDLTEERNAAAACEIVGIYFEVCRASPITTETDVAGLGEKREKRGALLGG